MRLLVIEDEPRLAASLAKGLREAAHAVDVSGGVADARGKLAGDLYDAILLDIGLPDGSGFRLAQELRTEGLETPILIITARDSVEDRVRGLDLGADDYLVKPFALEELLARLRAVTRRTPQIRPDILMVSDLEVDTRGRIARRGTRSIDLTTTEYALLEFLARHPGEVLSRTQITAALWDERHEPGSNIIDVYVGRIRKKIDLPGEVPLLHTMRGSGYSLGSLDQSA
jgi:DNA-binding response OmpR family regulator